MSTQWIHKALKAVDGTTEAGIRNRVWYAIILSIAATMIDYYYVYPNYSALPDRIATMHSWDGAATQWGEKSVFLEYEIERLFTLIFCVGICWLITHFYHSFVVKRIACFFIEATMLCITTGVGISLALLAIAMGERSASLSDYWEEIIMYFWLAVMLAELCYDCRHIRRSV